MMLSQIKLMKFRRILGTLSAAVLIFTVLASGARADDLDIFTPGVNIEPNVLFVFDTSGSMNDQIQSASYDPATTYTCATCTYTSQAVYQQDRWWFFWLDSYTKICDDINANPLVCSQNTPSAAGKQALLTNGFYFPSSNTRLYLGNYLNFKLTGGGQLRRKIDIAKEVLNDLIDNISGVRMGLMTFNNDNGGHVDFPVSTLDASGKASMKAAISAATPNGWTPLAETLYEAGLYFSGAASYYNSGVTYTTPIQLACQRNYVIVMTDGSSTQDRNIPSVITDLDGDGHEPGGAHTINYPDSGSDWMDDVAKYWLDTDMIDDSVMPEKQSMKTYTVGFSTTNDPLANPLLRDAAENGDGLFYTADNISQLKEALTYTLVSIAEDTNSFIAPIIPIDESNRTTSGDYVYLSLFAPSSLDALWQGNLKKFALNDAGDLIDANGNPATDADGNILDGAVSYWNTSGQADGKDVFKGGVEAVMQLRTSPRNIYTKVSGSNDLTDTANAFTDGNANITTAMLNAADATDRTKLINFVRGIDAYDDNGNNNATENRKKMVGDLLHSRPVEVHYDSSTTVLFVGSNDGMLHAFNDSDGSERWAFVPADVLGDLINLRGSTHVALVDAPVRAYTIDANDDHQIRTADGDKAIILFGRRRGGSTYTALDVTNPDAPQLLYEINPSTSGFSELGQSWSRPAIGLVKVGTTDTHVAFISGGYDTNEDNRPVTLADTRGRAVYAFNVLTGAKVWDWAYDASDTQKSQMVNAISSDISALDSDADGYIDRLYVGDLGGLLWRFEGTSNSPDITTWGGKIVFKAKEDGSDTARRKFMNPPDVIQESTFEVLLIGTGDRENPLGTSPIDRFYSIRDNDPSSPYDETDLVDFTDDLLQTGTSAQKTSAENALAASHGYFIRLVEDPTDTTGIGEKILSAPITFLGVTVFTSFTPNTSLQVCATGGTSRLYALNYLTGVSVLNFDRTNDTGGETGGDTVLARSDRSRGAGYSMASSAVIALRHGSSGGPSTAMAYVGTGGGVEKEKLQNPPSNVMLIQWQQLL
jgi:type IV pilus assembly protein PilY1